MCSFHYEIDILKSTAWISAPEPVSHIPDSVSIVTQVGALSIYDFIVVMLQHFSWQCFKYSEFPVIILYNRALDDVAVSCVLFCRTAERVLSVA